jgi:hypothetical protein
MRPVGSQHPFGLGQSLKPYPSPLQGGPSLHPTSFTLTAIPLPCGWDTTEVGLTGLTQLTRRNRQHQGEG